MRIDCSINGKNRSFDVDPTMRLREMLLINGDFAVRDSDDCEGFCGSDTVLVDGTPVFANLVLAGEVNGCEIRTPDGLGNSRHLTIGQQAMIEAGVVQKVQERDRSFVQTRARCHRKARCQDRRTSARIR